MASPQSYQLRLPDFFALCPFKASTNPFYNQINGEAIDWVIRHNVLTGDAYVRFLLGSGPMLMSYSYPLASREHFRTLCDIVNLLFVVDEISDEQSGDDARKTGLSIVRAFKCEESDNDPTALEKMSKEIKNRFFELGSENCFERFVKQFEAYVDAVAKEAVSRGHRGEVLDMDSFIPLRRRNSAVLTLFTLFEYAMGEDLPDEVHEDPTLANMRCAACDMVWLSNDIYSYKVEARLDIHYNNFVSVVLNEREISFQEVFDYAGEYYKGLVGKFLENKVKLPSWGPSVDKVVAGYVKGLEDWVVGNLEWSFGCRRYFESGRDRIRESLVLEMYSEAA
ncbi:terpenoid synthase [Gloeophyllum trabeum ATCC 11539]|uniref:Terpene synthase n=1 Tax=Gloeophyllum trabeum (strain ATCC 11539 / FP-39264 / Madison 617) TaxID=670483 RepID=S7RGX9_GLOTA|nr:terpenoid synthase [Gloeophyllum trabeum ATCC 11539]EPQ51824.1 terpenoid synthase [Gloeophyllum trabeum ATCC 11539]